ncbi:D-alanyl-D-alanine carboxypeptidase family protein [Salinibacterium sp. ZJ450]|uniref:D-alanyl-D-alanine carboxypeptidase family protein n=1 Tax=Salinibacterium sp. ZJ450 TaxID=2708338 RepID=UPI00141F8E42|nr:hypothetical protein [Salinibacterium sp. ZJ450]
MDQVSGSRRVVRGIGVAVGALIIVAAGVYTPLVLSVDTPATTPRLLPTQTDAAMAPVALPESGSSAVRLNGTVLADAGDTAPRPIAGAAKVVTALVVLDAFPLDAGAPGPSIPIGAVEDQRFRQMRDELGYRTVPVVAGQVWSQRETLQAALLSSSNNHAEMLAIWAFGSVDQYLAKARAWLDEHKFDDTTVVDPTGISPENLSTAIDLVRLTEQAFADPIIAEILQDSSVRTTSGTHVENTTAYLADEGVTALSRSYTDASAITLLFGLEVPIGDSTVMLYGTILGSPSYPTLKEDLAALVQSAVQNITELPLLAEGDPVAVYETEWGDTARVVAAESVTTVGWTGATIDAEVTLEPIPPTRAGTRVGSAVYQLASGEQTVRLVLDTALDGPDPFWLLTHPFAFNEG